MCPFPAYRCSHVHYHLILSGPLRGGVQNRHVGFAASCWESQDHCWMLLPEWFSVTFLESRQEEPLLGALDPRPPRHVCPEPTVPIPDHTPGLWHLLWALPGPILAWICPPRGQTTTMCTPRPQSSILQGWAELSPGGWRMHPRCRVLAGGRHRGWRPISPSG